MNFRRNERGQAFVITAFSLVVLIGMSALVLDVGSWFRDKRRLQSTSDAAALAGAQSLPDDPGSARSIALDYANKNGGDVAASDIKISSTYSSHDTISVHAKRTDAGVLSGVLGVTSANITADAKARVDTPEQAQYVAPMVVSCDHPLIKNCDGKGKPKFQTLTQMDYSDMGAPGAFGMLNLDGGTNPGSKKEAEWILHGFNKYLPLGQYRSDPGAKFSSGNIRDALTARIGTVLLFPVFRTLRGQGQNAEYEIIGWIGFHLDSFEVHGNNATLHGYFTLFIAHGILSQRGPSGQPYFGVRSVQLIE